jgi:hypothetical protein
MLRKQGGINRCDGALLLCNDGSISGSKRNCAAERGERVAQVPPRMVASNSNNAGLALVRRWRIARGRDANESADIEPSPLAFDLLQRKPLDRRQFIGAPARA